MKNIKCLIYSHIIALLVAVTGMVFTGCSDSGKSSQDTQKTGGAAVKKDTPVQGVEKDGEQEKKTENKAPETKKAAVVSSEPVKPAEVKPVAKKPAEKSALAQEKAERTKPRPAQKKIVSKPKPKLKPETILVRVNGEDITWRDVSKYTDMMASLMKNRRKGCTPEDIRRFKAKFTTRFSNELLQKKIVLTALAPSNIVVSAETKKQVERDFSRNYGGKLQDFNKLKAFLAKEGHGETLSAALDAEMKIKQFLTTVHSNEYYVTDQELKDVRRGMEIRNKIAAETNRLQVARAEMVLREIRKGADFAKMANEYSQEDERGQDPEEAKKAAAEGRKSVSNEHLNGGDLGDCDESDFVNDKHIWPKLLQMKAGEVSELLEIEEGYAIYKVLEIKKAEDSNTGDKSLHLARIFFRRAFEFPEQTDGELRIDVEREKRGDLTTSVFRTFLKMSKIEYPDGHIQLH